MIKNLVFAAILMTPLTSYAGCDELAERLNLQFGHMAQGETELPGRLRLSNCKALPFDPALTVVALANPRKGADFNYDMTIALISTSSQTLVARIDQKLNLVADADFLDRILIDTGRFTVATGVRAFGVRVRNGFSRHEFVEQETLNLYVLNGQLITPVLDSLVMHRSAFVPVNEDCNLGNVVIRTIAPGPGVSKGYADLIVSERRKKTTESTIGVTCSGEKSSRQRRMVLRFDGERYVVPADFRY